MKKLLILFIATILFISCSNENPFARKDGKTAKDGKEEKKDGDKTGDGFETGDGGKDDANSSWSSAFRQKQKQSCMDEYNDDPNAKQICACILDKVEQKFPEESDAKSVDEDDIDELIEGCEAKFRNVPNEDNGYVKTVERNDGYDEPRKPWTSLQHNAFVQTCAAAAKQQQGFTTKQANSYCECMTNKVERKFSFKEASNLKAEDFQTQEWINAAVECRGSNY